MKQFNFFSAIAAVVLLASCGSSGTSNKEKEAFWEGSVQPGSYTLSWRYTSAYGTNANKATLELVIFDNQEFELREKTECGLERIYHTGIVTMEGYVRKRTEMYNDQEKVWYTLNGTDSDNYSRSFSITPNGDFYADGANSHWQYIANSRPVDTLN